MAALNPSAIEWTPASTPTSTGTGAALSTAAGEGPAAPFADVADHFLPQVLSREQWQAQLELQQVQYHQVLLVQQQYYQAHGYMMAYDEGYQQEEDYAGYDVPEESSGATKIAPPDPRSAEDFPALPGSAPKGMGARGDAGTSVGESTLRGKKAPQKEKKVWGLSRAHAFPALPGSAPVRPAHTLLVQQPVLQPTTQLLPPPQPPPPPLDAAFTSPLPPPPPAAFTPPPPPPPLSAAASASDNSDYPYIPDYEDDHPHVLPMLARFNAIPSTANESLLVYCSRLSDTPQEHLARPIVQLQQMGMVQMFNFSFTDVKIVLLSLGPR
ncbi:hypothetical protein T492DRAFT_938442 [Pavlovales sp. CCMP2436]|nr:hypothetical protein T492DRAFT_938442 [Pavlovales sp. CCMP2436]